MNAVLRAWIAHLTVLLRAIGPYAAIELLLPGGSVIALFLWWYRRREGSELHQIGPGYPNRGNAAIWRHVRLVPCKLEC